MIYSVNSAQGLQVALRVATSGDEIRLAAGDYGSVTIQNKTFAEGLTISSANPFDTAKFTGLDLYNVSGMTIRGVEIDGGSGRGLEVVNSDHVTLDRLDVHGPLSATVPEGGGVYVTTSEYVNVLNSNFHHLGMALAHTNSQHVTFSGNAFRDIRSDGIRGGGSSHVEVSGNYFTDFYKQDGDHPDAIQFWTTNTTSAAHDILVKDNVFDRGDGNIAQGIFFRDESGVMPYERVIITGNAIVGGMYNGISMIGGKSVTISDNLVVGYKDMVSWIRVENSSDVNLTSNATTKFYFKNNGAGIVQSGSITVAQVASTDTSVLDSWLLKHVDAGAGETVLDQALPLAPTGVGTLVHVGTAANDVLVGTAGADLIDGGAGSDTMTGGAANDVYFVDSRYDVVNEASAGGIDTIITSVSSYSLAANVENLVLTARNTQAIYGNGLDNVITMSGVGGTVKAGEGNDTIIFKGGVATLTGGAGSDIFDFRAVPSTTATITDFTVGKDVVDLGSLLKGYTGTDPVKDGWIKFQAGTSSTTILVDQDGAGSALGFQSVVTLTGVTATSLKLGTDVLVAPSATGAVTSTAPAPTTTTDTSKVVTSPVVTSPTTTTTTTTFTEAGISEAIAKARLVTGFNAINGNDAQNSITGTAGADFIDGKGGLDTMAGGAGNDLYVVDNLRDQVTEAVGAGLDTVRTSYTTHTLAENVENLVLTGGSVQRVEGNGLNNVIIGNGVAGSISAGAGNDILVARGGDLYLTGGAGRDVFRFEAITKDFKWDPTQITDFQDGQDLIDLSQLLKNYNGVNAIADRWVDLRADAEGLVVYVDVDGAAGPAGMAPVVRLMGLSGSSGIGASDFLF